ncbi:hypothetical protein GCM10010519_50400 [Streptomyces lactacystinicus]
MASDFAAGPAPSSAPAADGTAGGTADGTAAAVRTATVAGIHGMVPLQAGLAARLGSLPAAALVLGALPLARRLSARRSPT